MYIASYFNVTLLYDFTRQSAFNKNLSKRNITITTSKSGMIFLVLIKYCSVIKHVQKTTAN